MKYGNCSIRETKAVIAINPVYFPCCVACSGVSKGLSITINSRTICSQTVNVDTNVSRKA